jgi:hypothetical protein
LEIGTELNLGGKRKIEKFEKLGKKDEMMGGGQKASAEKERRKSLGRAAWRAKRPVGPSEHKRSTFQSPVCPLKASKGFRAES